MVIEDHDVIAPLTKYYREATSLVGDNYYSDLNCFEEGVVGMRWAGRPLSAGWGDGRWWGFGFSRPGVLSIL